jgi:hypothetical protein
MAHIAIHVTDVDPRTAEGDLTIAGVAFLSTDGGQVNWAAYVAYTALAATINGACMDAAIAAAQAAGYTVGALDKKTIWGGAIGL